MNEILTRNVAEVLPSKERLKALMKKRKIRLYLGIDPTGAFDQKEVIKVVLTWFISPIVGFIISYILYKVIAKLFLNKLKGLNQIEYSEGIFSWALLIAVFGVSVYTGANSAEALGIIYALFKGKEINLQEYSISNYYYRAF